MKRNIIAKILLAALVQATPPHPSNWLEFVSSKLSGAKAI